MPDQPVTRFAAVLLPADWQAAIREIGRLTAESDAVFIRRAIHRLILVERRRLAIQSADLSEAPRRGRPRKKKSA